MNAASSGPFFATSSVQWNVEVYNPELNCIIFRGVLVPADYIPNIVAYANIFSDFVELLFRCDIRMSSPIGFDSTRLASRGLMIGFGIFLVLLKRTMIFESLQTLPMRSSYSTISLNDAVYYAFVNGVIRMEKRY